MTMGEDNLLSVHFQWTNSTLVSQKKKNKMPGEIYKKEPIYKVQTFGLKKATHNCMISTIPAYIYIKSNTTPLKFWLSTHHWPIHT